MRVRFWHIGRAPQQPFTVAGATYTLDPERTKSMTALGNQNQFVNSVDAYLDSGT